MFETFKLHDVLNSFANDENVEVRKTISTSLHEIAKIIGKSGSVYVRAAFSKLITDDDINVLKVIFKNMGKILEQLFSDESQKKVVFHF